MKSSIRRVALLALLGLLMEVALAPAANAERDLLSEAALETKECAKCTGSIAKVVPPPEGQIEGPCGLATSAAGEVYLADYFHRVIDVFDQPVGGLPGAYSGQLVPPGANPRLGVNTLDSVCGLAFDAAGNLYGNEWHQGVVQLTGGEATIDSGESTGVAVDSSTNRLYVDDRTYVAEYDLPYISGEEPLAKIGLGSLGKAYGLAAAEGYVYVADAADQTVKAFEPATSLTTPAATIAGAFNSLTDAALAVDPTNGHLLVVDDLQPGYEHPRSAVLEFGAPAEDFDLLGILAGAPIFGQPSGIAVTAEGDLLVTDGNGELANAYLYGPYESVPADAAESEPLLQSAESGITVSTPPTTPSPPTHQILRRKRVIRHHPRWKTHRRCRSTAASTGWPTASSSDNQIGGAYDCSPRQRWSGIADLRGRVRAHSVARSRQSRRM